MNGESLYAQPRVLTEVTTIWNDDGQAIRTGWHGRTMVLPRVEPTKLCAACWLERAAAIGGWRRGLRVCEHASAPVEEIIEL